MITGIREVQALLAWDGNRGVAPKRARRLENQILKGVVQQTLLI